MPWRKYSEEYKRHMSEVKKGIVFTEEHKRNISKSRKGKKLSPQHILNMSLSRKGNIPWNKGKKGVYKTSLETRKKLSETKKGDKAPSWKGGITPINKRIRHSVEYRIWKETIFKRDDFTCILCGKRGGTLNADHIKPFAYFPELRFSIENGRTLCVPCHRNTDTFGGKITNSMKKTLQ